MGSLRTEKEIINFTDLVEDKYLNTGNIMTDLELHNAAIVIERMITMYKNGLTNKEIKRNMLEVSKDYDSKVFPQYYEITKNKIEKELLKDGYIKDSKLYNQEVDIRILNATKKHYAKH